MAPPTPPIEALILALARAVADDEAADADLAVANQRKLEAHAKVTSARRDVQVAVNKNVEAINR